VIVEDVFRVESILALMEHVANYQVVVYIAVDFMMDRTMHMPSSCIS